METEREKKENSLKGKIRRRIRMSKRNTLKKGRMTSLVDTKNKTTRNEAFKVGKVAEGAPRK